MMRWKRRLCSLATGGVTLGILQGASGISWNEVWFQFLITWITALIQVFMGGDPSSVSGLSSLFQGFSV